MLRPVHWPTSLGVSVSKDLGLQERCPLLLGGKGASYLCFCPPGGGVRVATAERKVWKGLLRVLLSIHCFEV